MDERDRVRHIVKCLRIWQTGFLNSTAVWNEIFRLFGTDIPSELIGRVSPELREQMKQAFQEAVKTRYWETPPDTPVYQAFREWCKAS